MLQKQKSKLKIRSGLCFKWSERQARRSLRGLSALKFKSCPSGVFIIKKIGTTGFEPATPTTPR